MGGSFISFQLAEGLSGLGYGTCLVCSVPETCNETLRTGTHTLIGQDLKSNISARRVCRRRASQSSDNSEYSRSAVPTFRRRCPTEGVDMTPKLE